MTDDKTRAEFEKEFPLPDDCEWDGIEAYCWVYTRAPHPHNKHWEGWQAAKERYGQSMKQIGWTNPLQVAYVEDDDECAVYPDQESDCTIPVFIPAGAEEEWKPGCGCRFEDDHSNTVLVCDECSKSPAHNPDATKEQKHEQ